MYLVNKGKTYAQAVKRVRVRCESREDRIIVKRKRVPLNGDASLERSTPCKVLRIFQDNSGL